MGLCRPGPSDRSAAAVRSAPFRAALHCTALGCAALRPQRDAPGARGCSCAEAYTGDRCAQCAAGAYRIGARCYACGGEWAAVVMMVLFFLGIVAFMAIALVSMLGDARVGTPWTYVVRSVQLWGRRTRRRALRPGGGRPTV